MDLKEIRRNIGNAVFYWTATWLYNFGGWIQRNELKLIGLLFLVFACLFCYLPTSEAKMIGMIFFIVGGFGLILTKEK